jgi:hypothetical protein
MNQTGGMTERIQTLLAASWLAVLGLTGCATAAAPLPPEDPAPIQRMAESGTALDRPYRIVFRWSYQEAGTRVAGQGVARIEPPFKARLDLFASNGERLAAAALMDDELRLAPGLDGITLPPVPMLWGALGVFRPGPGLYGVTATRSANDRAELRYLVREGGELRVRVRDGRMEFMERITASGARQELRLTLSAGGERFPSDAIYRDLSAVQELRITMETVEAVEAYPLNVWDPRD